MMEPSNELFVTILVWTADCDEYYCAWMLVEADSEESARSQIWEAVGDETWLRAHFDELYGSDPLDSLLDNGMSTIEVIPLEVLCTRRATLVPSITFDPSEESSLSPSSPSEAQMWLKGYLEEWGRGHAEARRGVSVAWEIIVAHLQVLAAHDLAEAKELRRNLVKSMEELVLDGWPCHWPPLPAHWGNKGEPGTNL